MSSLPFPEHNPDFPDVNPATGDERETEPNEPDWILSDPLGRPAGPVASHATLPGMADNVYEIVVERKLRDRFLVAARSSAEAAAAVGANLSSAAPFNISETIEVDRKMLNPRVVRGGTVAQVREFESTQLGEDPPNYDGAVPADQLDTPEPDA